METEKISPSNLEGVSGEAGRGSLYEEKVADGGAPPDDGRGEEAAQPNVGIAGQAHNDEGVPEVRDFPTHWHTMLTQVFSSIPIIYYSLKETLPEIKNNIIHVVVKNTLQKEHFEAKTRDVLAFLRTHFDEKIEDVIVEANEQLETKKIIYDVKDKLQNFKEQNAEFDDFIQILDLKIKD